MMGCGTWSNGVMESWVGGARTLFLTLALSVVGLASASAQIRPEKLRVVYSAIGSSQSPLWIAHEAGIFKKHGLDVELLYAAGGSRAAQVILAGEAPAAMFNGSSVISANLAGADLVNLASGMNVLPFLLVVPPGMKQIEELKGKKVAITRFGSATDFALRFAAEKWSIKPDKDFAVLQLNGQPEMMAALKSGAVQGAMLNAEFAILARREGFRDLVDVAALGLTFPGSGLQTSRTLFAAGVIPFCACSAPMSKACITASLRKNSRLACSVDTCAVRTCHFSKRCTRCISAATSRKFPTRRQKR
jgi:ABC-type nitrate/sulfonate/bicarbonate transport system substrate-binding protein